MSDSTKTSDLLKWLWTGFLAKHWVVLLAAGLFMALEGLMMGATSYMMRPMFDNVFVQGSYSALWAVGFTILGIFAVRAVAGVGYKVSLTIATQRTSADIRCTMLDRVLRQDGSFFQTHAPGFLIQRVQSDVELINQVWRAIAMGIGRDAISLLALIAVAIHVDWKWTVVACIGTPILILPSLTVQQYVRRKSRAARDLGAVLATRLDEIFHGITPIKLNTLEEYQSKQYRNHTDDLINTEVKANFGSALMPGLIDLMAGVGFLGVLVYGGGEIIAGEKTIGQFMSFFTAIGFAFEPLRKLGAISGQWQIAAAAIERVREIMESQPKLVSPDTPKDTPTGPMDVVLKDVNLAYGETKVLRGANLVAPAGKTTAIVGASGAGKSTIFNVLTRLVDPQEGAVTLGGVSVKDMDLHALRQLFSVVSQEALLFDETLRENILLGRTDVSEEHLKNTLDAAHVTDFLENLPAGLDTPVGPRGSNLSGGQRQRVVIARALLRNTPILLLDEATSALDTQSETKVQAALERLAEGRTTLVIAHRLSTVREADQILVMDQGQIVDSGRHDDLMSHNGLYADLYNLQFKTDGETAEARARAAQAQAQATPTPKIKRGFLARLFAR